MSFLLVAILSQIPLAKGNSQNLKLQTRQYVENSILELRSQNRAGIGKTAPQGRLIAENDVSVAKKENPTEAIISLVFKDKANEAIKIAKCESELNQNAKNEEDKKITGYISWGLFMINSPKFKNWNNAYTNTIRAKEIYDKVGWRAWKFCAEKHQLLTLQKN